MTIYPTFCNHRVFCVLFTNARLPTGTTSKLKDKLIAILNLIFSCCFVFHDISKRTRQGNLLLKDPKALHMKPVDLKTSVKSNEHFYLFHWRQNLDKIGHLSENSLVSCQKKTTRFRVSKLFSLHCIACEFMLL